MVLKIFSTLNQLNLYVSAFVYKFTHNSVNMFIIYTCV